MKYLYVIIFLIPGILFSAACTAEEELEKHVVIVESGEKIGLGVAIIDLNEEKQKELNRIRYEAVTKIGDALHRNIREVFAQS